jgi:hypothetical protein
MTDAMNCIAKMNVIYGVKNVQNHMSYVLSYVRNLGQSTRDKYYDYIKMTCAIKNLVGKPRWKFQDENDIKTAHDEMMFIYNMHKDDEREKEWQRKFNAVKPNLDALSYKEEEFSIIAPEKPSDIANEGLALNHCVKSYIDAVVDGRTNIMFVRKTNDLKKPFYTLEVQNNQIRQCHGFCNSNVDAVCGLESFLRRYCKTIGITYQKGDRALAVG